MIVKGIVNQNNGPAGAASVVFRAADAQGISSEGLINRMTGDACRLMRIGASGTCWRLAVGRPMPKGFVEIDFRRSAKGWTYGIKGVSTDVGVGYDWDIDTNFYGGQIAASQSRPTEPRKPVIPTKPPKSLHLDIQQWFQEIMGAGVGRIDILFKKLDAELKLKLNAVNFGDAFYKSMTHRMLRRRDQLMIAISRPGPVALRLLRKYRLPFLHLDWNGDKKLKVLSGSVQNHRTRSFVKKYNKLVVA